MVRNMSTLVPKARPVRGFNSFEKNVRQNGSFAHKLGMKWNFHHKNVAFHPMKKPHETPPEPSLPPGPFMQRKATVRDFTKPVTEILKVAWAVIWILEEKKREG